MEEEKEPPTTGKKGREGNGRKEGNRTRRSIFFIKMQLQNIISKFISTKTSLKRPKNIVFLNYVNYFKLFQNFFLNLSFFLFIYLFVYLFIFTFFCWSSFSLVVITYFREGFFCCDEEDGF